MPTVYSFQFQPQIDHGERCTNGEEQSIQSDKPFIDKVKSYAGKILMKFIRFRTKKKRSTRNEHRS